jgi:xanthine dehydrogenase YagS FAD-binding subunit
MINFEYTRVNTIEAALAAWKKNPGSAYIAGGTNLVDLMKNGVTVPGRLIDITPIPLKEVSVKGSVLRVGALVANSDLAEHPLVKEKLPLLSRALLAGASAQLRNMATVGGNLLQRTRCSYFYDNDMPCNKRIPGSGCGAREGINRMHAIFGHSDACIAVHPSDMCVALAALEATVEVRGTAGSRRIAIADFHRLPGNDAVNDNTLRPGELITGIEIPIPPADTQAGYLKIRDRASYAFALVSSAVLLNQREGIVTRARIALGGVAHKPWRLPKVEQYLTGKKLTDAVLNEAAKLSTEGAKAFEHNQFKLKLLPAMLEESLRQTAGNI